ncbi:unnamed protein product, partial [Polarella glacialis]
CSRFGSQFSPVALGFHWQSVRLLKMAQRPSSSSLALGAAGVGGMMLLGSSSQSFVSTPAQAASPSPNLRASSAVSQTQQPAASSAPASSAVPVIACGGLAAAALAGQRASRRQNRSSALPTVVPVQSSVQRRALDQSSRYADL